MTMKIICVNATSDSYDEYSPEPVDIETNVYNSFEELFKNPDFKKAMNEAGWVSKKELDKISNELEYTDKYYLSADLNSLYSQIREIDITNLNNEEVRRLSQGHAILRKINPKAVLTEKQYDLIKKENKRRDNMEKARIASAKQRTEKARLKKLEKARKILEQANEM